MNKKAQFKVSLKSYLNTHSFYSVEEFLTFKIRTKIFSLTVLLCGLCICVYFMSNFVLYEEESKSNLNMAIKS
jgi:hypothetical protein